MQTVQHASPEPGQPPASRIRAEPGVAVLPMINWGGLRTLYVKEVRRFFKVQLQTVWAPAITTLMYLIIFTVALGRSGRTVMGFPLAQFLAPGLIVSTGMLQNAFANAWFSLLVGKVQGTIVDYLMPPLSTGELLGALVSAAVTRAVLVGFAVWLAMVCWLGRGVVPVVPWAVVWFGVGGAAMLALTGVLTSIWATKFDHAAAIQNFVVAPLTLLSGTFYSIQQLSPWVQTVSRLNPFFYVIDGFRYGFLGVTDAPIVPGALVILGLDLVLAALCYALLARGWRLKA